MNWTYRKPLITSVTTLKNAKGGTDASPTAQFQINWSYPTNFLNPVGTHDPSDVLYYEIYRHIETTYPISNADGGPTHNPAYLGDQPDYEPRYYKIATLDNSYTSYIDDLSNLSTHSSDGVVQSGGRWVDGAGTDIIKDIVETKRRIYYKVVAISKRMIFNNLPFLFIAHTTGYAECRSTIRQCKWNRLYDEGETVWVRNLGGGQLLRTSVDPIYDIANDRTLNVWFTDNASTVYCVDGRTGDIKQTYTIGSLVNIQSIRVDPSTGDAIVLGDTNTMWRCILSNGTTTSIGNMGVTEYSPYGNVGLIINVENSAYKIYSIANTKKVVTWPLALPIGVELPKSLIGDTDGSSQVPASHRNAFGITNGVDQSVWVNGHVPGHFYYTEVLSYQIPGACYWVVPECILSPNTGRYYCGGAWQRSQSNPNHWHCDPPVTVYYTVEYNFWLLQDIGYLYGVGQENYGQTHNDQVNNFANPRPFTRCSGSRSGWAGATIYEPEKGYSCGDVSRGKTQPEPTVAQYGLACDIPDNGLLRNTTTVYNIWQSNLPESRINRLSAYYDGSTTTVNYASIVGATTQVDYFENINNPYHICIDSSNSVWGIQNDTTNNRALTKIYQLLPGTTFPYQGNCTWPTRTPPTITNGKFTATTTNYDYDTPFNDAFVEYVLTRSVVPVTTATAGGEGYFTGGIKINGIDRSDEIRIAREWCVANVATSLPGTRIYPYYTGTLKCSASFGFYGISTHGQTEFNSDNTGNCYLFTVQNVQSDPAFIRPVEEYPSTNLKIYFKKSTPRLGDLTFWDAQSAENTNNTSTSGYDDLTVILSAGAYNGTFGVGAWEFGYGDKIHDIGGLTNDYSSGLIYTNETSYKYNDPSQSGKPTQRRSGYPGEVNGVYQPNVSAWYHKNAYLINGIDPDTIGSYASSSGYVSLTGNVFATSPLVSAYVWERWPTAEFYINTFELSTCRPSGWKWTPPLPTVGDNNLPEQNPDRIVFGYDPVSAQFTDYSVGRTWPVSAWYWDFGDEETFLGFTLPPLDPACGGPHVTSAVLVCSDPTFHPRDNALIVHRNMISHFYRGAGTYYATLWVQASNTGTDSWCISAGVIDPTVIASTFTIAATREIDVYEACPEANFTLVSGATVPSDYSDQSDTMFDVNLSGVQAFQTLDGEFISGYAPNLTVYWEGCAFPRSLPLCAAVWDFGDFYNEGSIYIDSFASDVTGRYNYPTDTILYPYPISGWPYWDIPGGYSGAIHTRHTFVMPGFYDVTMYAIASSTRLTTTCGPCAKLLHVYVQELIPRPCFETSYTAMSGYDNTIKGGTSPFTLYFNPSCTLPGSFPICKLDWDFGDGSPITTVSRLFSSDYVFTPGITAFPNDPADPRNIIINHTYERTMFNQSPTVTVYLSAYACNTNTVGIISGTVSSIDLIGLTVNEGDIHLIQNRMFKEDDNLMLVFESEKNQKTYSVLVSSSLIM